MESVAQLRRRRGPRSKATGEMVSSQGPEAAADTTGPRGTTLGWLLVIAGVVGAIVISIVRSNAEEDHAFDQEVSELSAALGGRTHTNMEFADGGFIFGWVVCGLLVLCGFMLIAAAVAQSKPPQAVTTREPAVAEAEQIRKLAELRDEGILTDEEFETKKRRILGL